jgi:hypothetical protein
MISAKIGTDRQILAKLPSIKFHEYLFSDRHTNMAYLMGIFLQIFVAHEPMTTVNDYIVFF